VVTKQIAGDKPPLYEKTMPEIYETDELSAVFKSLE
jgi:hypothetical protein